MKKKVWRYSLDVQHTRVWLESSQRLRNVIVIAHREGELKTIVEKRNAGLKHFAVAPRVS
jgi:hypothetical protein